MNQVIPSLVIACLACGGIAIVGSARADDTMSQASMSPHQALKDCIEQQKTSNVNMSKSAMKRLCKDKLKQQKATGDMPQQPPTDVPHN